MLGRAPPNAHEARACADDACWCRGSVRRGGLPLRGCPRAGSSGGGALRCEAGSDLSPRSLSVSSRNPSMYATRRAMVIRREAKAMARAGGRKRLRRLPPRLHCVARATPHGCRWWTNGIDAIRVPLRRLRGLSARGDCAAPVDVGSVSPLGRRAHVQDGLMSRASEGRNGTGRLMALEQAYDDSCGAHS